MTERQTAQRTNSMKRLLRLAEPQSLPSIAALKQRNRPAFGQSKKNCGGLKKLVVKEI
jgi:hypothetical protein